MFFYKQRENSQKMHVFVQRPQKISKKAGSPIRTYPSWSNRLRTGADQTALRAQEPAGSLRQKNKKTQSIENRYPVLVRVTRFEPVACRLRSASRRRIERRFAPKSPLVLCGKRTKKTQSIENRYSALSFVAEKDTAWKALRLNGFRVLRNFCFCFSALFSSHFRTPI